MMMIMIKEKGDVRPLLVKFGVALALSFAGFLYTRIRNKRIMPSDGPPFPPPSNSDANRKVDQGRRLRIKDYPQPEMEMEMESSDSYDKPCIRVCADSSSRHGSPSGRYSGGKDGFLLPEFDQLVKDLNTSTISNPDNVEGLMNNLPKTIYSIERGSDYEHKIEDLKRRVRYLRERVRILEVQLLEYYVLKEQETTIMEIKNRLKISKTEAKLFSVKIESLQAENKRIASQVVDYSKVVSELEDSKAKIKLLKRKIMLEAQLSKEQILDLSQEVRSLKDKEHDDGLSDFDGHSELHRINRLEDEVEELRNLNESLKIENDGLARMLESTQLLANSLLEDPEKEGLNKEMLHLRQENENLMKEVERLQADRFTDINELVYLRWINACLRYELRNYQPPPGKTVARDLSKCLSPNSEKKAKEFILEYSNSEDGNHHEPSIVDFDMENWPSSRPSYLTDSTEHDESPCDGSDHKRHHKKLKIFTRLRRLIRGKHSRNDRVSPMYQSHLVDHDIRKRCSSKSPPSIPCYEGGTYRSPKLASSSRNSNNLYIEFQPLSRLDEQDPKDIGKTIRMSDYGSSPSGVSFVLGSKSTNSSPFDGAKSELDKYAVVLRDSEVLPKMHKKSASYSGGLR